MLIFSYGSNLCRERLADRVPAAEYVATGYVARRALRLHKFGADGYWTGRAADRVWGAVYRVPISEKAALDRHEFLGTGYDDHAAVVYTGGRLLAARLYAARREAIAPGLLPFLWYRELIIRGARQHRLPAEYIARLRRLPATRDPDAVRAERHWRLLTTLG